MSKKMRKKSVAIIAMLLILISAFTLAACDNDVPPEISAEATAFIVSVEDIGTVSLESGTKIETAIGLYNALSETDKALTEVIAAKAIYDTKKEAYDVLVLDKTTADEANAFKALANAIPAPAALTTSSEHKKAISDARASYDQLSNASKVLSVTEFNKLVTAESKMNDLIELEDANAFAALANNLPATVTLSDEAAVAAAETAYNGLTAAAKAFANVVTAKAKVDAARTHITDLTAAVAYIALVNQIPAAVTLTEENTVAVAEAAYETLSATAQAMEDVSIAHTKMTQARNRLTVLGTAKLAADAFIALVGNLPAETALVETDITAINEAITAYGNLNTDAKGMSGVSDANTQLEALHVAYNDKFDIKRIPISGVITFEDDELKFNASIISDVADFFQTTQANLGDKVKMFLYVYFASETATGNSLFRMELNVTEQTGTVAADDIIQALKDSYISSTYTNGVTPDKQYKFAILFANLTSDPKITDSNYSAFSPNHSFTYDKPLTPDEQEAQSFLGLANSIPALNEMTTSAAHKKAITDARTAYNGLGNGAKALSEVVTAYGKLTAAEAKMADLIAIEVSAEFIRLVGLISNPVTLEDANAILTARAFYDAHVENNEQASAKPGMTDALSTLTAAESAIGPLVIAEEIRGFTELVEAISDPATQAQVDAARTYYNNMGNTAKADSAVIAAYAILTVAEEDLLVGGLTRITLDPFFGIEFNPSLAWGSGAGFAQSFKAKYGDSGMTDAKLLTLVHFRVWIYNSGDLSTPLFYYDLQVGELTMLMTGRLNSIFTQNRDKLTAAFDVAANYTFRLQVMDARGTANSAKRVHFDSQLAQCGQSFSYTKLPTAAEIEAKAFLNAAAEMPAINTIVFDTLNDTEALAKIQAVRTAYDNLSTEAKVAAGVAETLTLLSAAETKLTDLTAAKTAAISFLALMQQLPASPDGFTAENYASYKTALMAAESGVLTLTDLAKTYAGVTEATTLLTNLRSKFNILLAVDDEEEAANQNAAAFISLVEAISETVTLSDKTAIESARAWYDLYIVGQLAAGKEGVAEAYAALQSAESVLAPLLAEQAKATSFVNAVNSIIIPESNVLGTELLSLKSGYDAALAYYDANVKNNAAINTLPEVIAAKTLLDSALTRYASSYNALLQMPVSYIGMVVDHRGYVWAATTFNGQNPSTAVSSGNTYIRVYFYNSTENNEANYLFYINITTGLSGETGIAMFQNALADNVQCLSSRPGVAASYKVNLRGEDRTGNYKPSDWHGFQTLGGLSYTIPATNKQLFELRVEEIGTVTANAATGTRVAAAKTAWNVLTAAEKEETEMAALYNQMIAKETAYFTAYAALVTNPGTAANAAAIVNAFSVYDGMLADSKTAAAAAFSGLVANDGRHFIALVAKVEDSRIDSKLVPESIGLIDAAKLYLDYTLFSAAKLLDGTEGAPNVVAAIAQLEAMILEWEQMNDVPQVLDMDQCLVVYGTPVYGTYNSAGYNVTLPVTVTFFADDDFPFVSALEFASIVISGNEPNAGSFVLSKVAEQVGVYTASLIISMPGTGSRTFTAQILVEDEIVFADINNANAPAKTVAAHVNSFPQLTALSGAPVVEFTGFSRGILTGGTFGGNTDFSSGRGRLSINVYVGGVFKGVVYFTAAQSRNDQIISISDLSNAIKTQTGLSVGTAVTFKFLLTCSSFITTGNRLYRDSNQSATSYSFTIT